MEKCPQKIAIVHHTLAAMGGGERVGATLIEALNEVGIRPDVYSTAPIPKEYFNSFYNKKLEYKLISLFPFRIKIFGIYQKILSSYSSFRLINYDVVVNTTGVYTPMLFNNLLKRYILYLYNPYVMMKDQKYVAKPLSISKYDKSLFWKLYYIPYKNILSYSIKHIKAEVLAVSRFTQWRLKEFAGMESKVVYPPVDIETFSTVFNNKDRNGVISIGRFTPEKEQLKQLEIAKYLPSMTFRICGSAKTPYYWRWFQHVKAKAEEMNLKNVEFYPNISLKRLVSLIGESKIFIHNMLYEDFGLSTCEAIAGGCIPCVIDSGGQKEIVFIRDLRFRDIKEAIGIIQKINNMESRDLESLRKSLFEHIKQYDERNFKENMLKVIFNESKNCKEFVKANLKSKFLTG